MRKTNKECSNGHEKVTWLYKGNKKNKPQCPFCHKEETKEECFCEKLRKNGEDVACFLCGVGV